MQWLWVQRGMAAASIYSLSLKWEVLLFPAAELLALEEMKGRQAEVLSQILAPMAAVCFSGVHSPRPV